MHLDKHFARTRPRRGHLAEVQPLGRAELVDDDGAHRLSAATA